MKRKLEKKVSVIGLFWVLAFTSCVTPYYRTHNQNEAAEIAKSFAHSAFVEKDKGKAFSYLRSDVIEGFNADSLWKIVEKMHPNDKYPKIVFPLEYEIVPNSGIIRIFLKGESTNKDEFYYMIAKVKENNGYKVSELFRNNENAPYPKTPLRKTF